jgi:uncharacterized delta-60 repeat protein
MGRHHRLAAGVAGLLLLASSPGVGSSPVGASPGETDQTFGRGGAVLTDRSGLDAGFDLLVQPDGKTVTVGVADGDPIVLRHNPDGALDASFGTGGVVRGSPVPAFFEAAVLQGDGKIVVAGTDGTIDDIVVVRYLPNGTPDPAFGTGGSVRTNLGSADEAAAVTLQTDGKIVVAGRSGSAIALARYTTAGALDATFGTGGTSTTSFGSAGSGAFANAVAVLSTGSIIVGGTTSDSSGANVTMLLARFTAGGALDPTYGSAGRVAAAATRLTNLTAVVVQSGDRVVAAGSIDGTGSEAHGLARYLPDGSLDATFGTAAGVTRTQLALFGGTEDLTVDGAGRLVAAGDATNDPEKPAGFLFVAVLRYSPDGVPDSAFGCAGATQIELSTQVGGRSTAVGITPDGNIVVGGIAFIDRTTDFGRPDFLLVRVLSEGTVDAGYWITRADGGVTPFGTAGGCGSLRGKPLNRAIVGHAAFPDLDGYWLVASDGGVFTEGNATFFGSAGALPLARPIVGMAAMPDGNGYWLVAADGGIFAYGAARFFGSTGAMRLNKPIVGMARTPTGNGYWLVASDGGIFAFGDAGFHGSTGAMRLNRAVVGMAATPSGNGYWLVAADGGIFAFGDAGFHGSTGAMTLNRAIVGMARTIAGNGYWLVAADGGIFAFGLAPFKGSTGNQPFESPAVALT